MAGDKNTILKYLIAFFAVLAINIALGLVIVDKILNYTYSTEDLDTLSSEVDENDDGVDGNSESFGKSVGPLDINLNPRNSSGEIFSCSISFELPEDDETEEYTKKTNHIMDKLSSYLSMKTVEELSDQKQWDTYRKDMINIINKEILNKTKVINLFVTSKIISYD